MYAIVIGASSESIHAIKTAQAKGLKVLAFDVDSKAKGLKYADEYFVVDIRNPMNIFSVVDGKGIHDNEMIVLPIPIGRCLVSVGAFNDHYGLVGVKLKTTEICTDKWLFHQTMSAQKLRNINCILLEKGQNKVSVCRYPAIIKPRYGAGSREVLRLSCSADLDKVKEKLPFDEDFIIEDEVEGDEYGIDGMVFNGEFRLILTRKKLLTSPPYRQCVGYISVNKEDIRNMIIRSFMTKLVSAIKLDAGIVHADIIMDKGNPFVIEMSARPSGHRLHDLFTPMVTRVDMISDFIDYALGKKMDNYVNRNEGVYIIRYFDMESVIKRVPNREYMIKKYSLLKYECNLVKGEKIKVKDGHSLMGRGFFIIRGTSEKEILDRADMVLREYI